MSKGYWIVHVDIGDTEAFKAYMAANAIALHAFGARFIVRGGAFATVEGQARSRHTIIEFPSYQAAMDCWNSPLYQQARQWRKDAALIDIVVIEGVGDALPQ